MKTLILSPLILIMLCLISCSKETVKSDKESGSSEASEKDSTSIIYSKTACYGKCPVYTMTINGDGSVVFEGKENIDKIGKYSLQLTAGEMDSLISAFEESRFFELNDRYYEDYTDLPTTFITFTHKSRTKKIVDYYGAPKRLKILESKIEEIVKKDGWKKAN